jgi:hypothetical protein
MNRRPQRHDRAAGIQAAEQHQHRRPRRIPPDACGRPAESLPGAILLVRFAAVRAEAWEPGRVPAPDSVMLKEVGEQPACDLIQVLPRADSRLLSAIL